MTGFPIQESVSGLLAIGLIHLVVGVILGRWFRFGVLLPAFAIVLVESVIGDVRLGLAPWYVLLVAGVVIVQLGYAAAARLRTVSHVQRRPTDPGSMRAPARD